MSLIEKFEKIIKIPSKRLVKSEYNDLCNVLNEWSHEYYILGEPSVPDATYDEGYRKLKEVEEINKEWINSNSPTQKTGEEGGDIVHSKKMLSISNATEKTLDNLLEKTSVFSIEPKYDGVAAKIVYKDGKLNIAATRGDGERGKDITRHILNNNTVPNKIPSDDLIEVRGEIILNFSNFESLNEYSRKIGGREYANTRNAVAGLISRKEKDEYISSLFTFMPYSVIGLDIDSHSKTLKKINEWGFSVSPLAVVCSNPGDVKKEIQKIQDIRDSLDYEIDGAVIKVDSLSLQEEMGYTAKSPRSMLAQKFPPKQALTKIKSVDFQVGKTGRITPVANIEPVNLQGSTISRVTLHNMDEIERLSIGINDHVVIEKGGDVIPKVVKLAKKAEGLDRVEIKAPTSCPVCNSGTNKDDAILYCVGSLVCSAQIKGKVKYFISKKGMDIDGLGVKMAEELIERGLIEDFADIYTLTEYDFRKIERQGDKSISNALMSIEKSRDVKLERLVGSLGIPNVSTSTAKLLSKKFGTMDKIMEAKSEDLMEIDGIGDVVALNIFEFFNDDKNKRMIEKLTKEVGLRIINPEVPKEDELVLKGKTFVITGSFVDNEGSKVSRDLIKDFLESKGAKISGSISGKTDFLIAGENAGSKLDKAEKLKVKIIEGGEFSESIIDEIVEKKSLNNKKNKIS